MMVKLYFYIAVVFMFLFLNPSFAQESGSNGTFNETNQTPYTDPEISEALKNSPEIRVIVELRDNSDIAINGTEEERIGLSRQRDEWFKVAINEVFATLSEDEFRIIGSKTSIGFDGYLTKKGLDKLTKDSRVSSIYLDRIVYGTDSSNKTLPKSISTSWEKTEPKVEKNESELEKTKSGKNATLWFLVVIVVFILIVVYLFTKFR